MENTKQWFLKFQMETWWNKKVEDLSKGMSQKLQFVTTVVHNPKLIILDEPFSGLDPVNANLIKEEIFRLANEGATIIFSTHRMEQVEEICDHIVLVNLGKKILDGSVADIKQQFKENNFSIEIKAGSSISSNAIFTIINDTDAKYLIKINEGYTVNNVLQHIIEQKIELIGFNEVLPSLNEIFIKLVEGTHAGARAFQNI
jgi:ABC-2 type transport system ATP-binding protein